MSLSTILLTIALIIVLGAAIYFWSDYKDYRQKYRDAIAVCQSLDNELREAHSFQKALDDENEQLTVKCYQYEALLKTRLDDIPVADLDEFCQEDKEKIRKPCCLCWNGVYNIPACEDCCEANGYENYISIDMKGE